MQVTPDETAAVVRLREAMAIAQYAIFNGLTLADIMAFQGGPPATRDEPPAMTIAQFCTRNQISATFYQKLRRLSLGPTELRAGGHIVRITPQSEAAWRAARENPQAAEARLIAREQAVARAQRRAAGRASAASPRHVSKQER
jgi:hypothetical protein